MESSETPGQHYQGDVREVMCDLAWDLIVLFPPCTDISQAGAVWWKQKQADFRQQRAERFFLEMVFAAAPYVAVENPFGVMSKVYRKSDQVVQPWWFGDPLEKRTCLWLKELPLLTADRPVVPQGRVAGGGGSHRTDKAAGHAETNSAYEDSEGRKNRAKMRGTTLPGLARAMADQWGSFVEAEMDHVAA